MKKSQFLIATLCVSAMVLSACTLGTTTKKKKKKSSSAEVTSVVPGSNTSGNPTSGIPGGSSATPGGSSATPGGSSQPGPAVVSVTGVSIEGSASISKQVGDAAFSLVATVAPSNATNKSVSWASSAPAVATVSSAGLVSIVAAGETDITVTTADGGFTASVHLTVSAPVAWSAEEKAIFASELYGYEIPIFAAHHSDMTLKAMSDGGVSYMGGTSSQALIQEYAALVPADFGMKQSSNTSIYAYVGEAEISTSEGKRHVDIAVFGITEDSSGNQSISADGSGTFCVQAYDPYYYDWAEFGEDVDLVAQIFATIGTPGWRDEDLVEVSVPALSGTDVFYEVDFDGFSDFYTYQIYYEAWMEDIASAYIEIYAICSSAQFDSYLGQFDALTDAWEYVGVYNNGYYDYYVYDSLLGKASVEVGYYSAGGFAIIDVVPTYTTAFPAKQVEDYIAADRPEPQAFPTLDVDEGAFYVNEFDGSIYVDLYVYDDDEFTQETVDAYVEGLDPEKFSYDKMQGVFCLKTFYDSTTREIVNYYDVAGQNDKHGYYFIYSKHGSYKAFCNVASKDCELLYSCVVQYDGTYNFSKVPNVDNVKRKNIGCVF